MDMMAFKSKWNSFAQRKVDERCCRLVSPQNSPSTLEYHPNTSVIEALGPPLKKCVSAVFLFLDREFNHIGKALLKIQDD